MLDINTPKGQESLKHEEDAIRIFERNVPNALCVATKKDTAADIDGVITSEDHELLGIYETKCRDMTLSTLKEKFSNEWLVSLDKLARAANLARALRTGVWGFLYLIPEKTLLSIKLMNEHGELLPDVRITRSETQKTINGGHVVRTNAYVSMTTAKAYK